jgi:hypothetical protein
MHMAAETKSGSLLQRMLATGTGELPAEVAGFFLGLSFPAADQERISELSEKANEGDLEPQERDELALYVLVGDFLAIMQSRARASLSKRTPAI